MYRLLTAIFLSAYIPWLYANDHKIELSAQTKQDIELVKSFKDFSKQSSGGDIITVGGDPNGCQFNNIQDAIDTIPNAGSGTIHLATNKTYNENLVIDDISVSLIGGYSDCTAAGSPFIQPSDNQVLVNGGNVASVIKITGNSQRNTVLLRNLRFIEGLGAAPNSDSAGGGILAYEADIALSLTNVDITSNDAEYGGGIALVGGDTDMLLQNSRVFNNLAKYGGGVYCDGGGSSIVMIESSGVVANVANGDPNGNNNKAGDGAGLYLSSCYFGLYSGSAEGGLAGISSNFAFGDGGGIFADTSTILLNGHQTCNAETCIGDDTNPVNVNGNVSGFTHEYGLGGGILARESTVTIYAGLIEGNSTNNQGGGVFLGSRSSLTIGRLKKACWNQNHCNYLANNNVTGMTTFGGAITTFFSDVDISASVFENNTAMHGAALHSNGFDSSQHKLRVESSLFFQNGDATKSESIILNIGDIDVTFIHTTIADNNIKDENPEAAIFQSNQSSGLNPSLSLYSNIIYNPDFDVFSHDSSTSIEVDFSCIIANETESMSASNNLINFSEGTAGGAFITQDNPIFLDPQNSNYNLAGNSPAIDYCNTPTYTTVSHKDIDFEDRGYDDPNVDDLSLFTFYDLGVDESYVNDRIFKNGFE